MAALLPELAHLGTWAQLVRPVVAHHREASAADRVEQPRIGQHELRDLHRSRGRRGGKSHSFLVRHEIAAPHARSAAVRPSRGPPVCCGCRPLDRLQLRQLLGVPFLLRSELLAVLLGGLGSRALAMLGGLGSRALAITLAL